MIKYGFLLPVKYLSPRPSVSDCKSWLKSRNKKKRLLRRRKNERRKKSRKKRSEKRNNRKVRKKKRTLDLRQILS